MQFNSGWGEKKNLSWDYYDKKINTQNSEIIEMDLNH